MQRCATILSIAFLFSAALAPTRAEQGTRITSGAFVFESF
jgi:hypothetical protein